MRTGSEPLTARSALRLRLGLAAFGLAWAVVGAVGFAVAGHTAWAVTFAVVGVVAVVDMFVVGRHIHQGAHYQPGRDIPPYRPDRGGDTHLRHHGP
ncbi:hypothetical protein G3I60_05835 [Streptomyces sp. SID13666]|uniref:DUF6343 family protein n=1 Tax=unclassified Streptomyces TaxID=2593676 RepID=UPI0013BFCBBF|nr:MULTISPECIES: DUF6343 family protein [unclassified Streptomyces]NEA53688.1 hypothetical protein [Streptomyces sp. SID13666]NEA71466.1 hypothetical protein [Streptomyces sp. SID13588]